MSAFLFRRCSFTFDIFLHDEADSSMQYAGRWTTSRFGLRSMEETLSFFEAFIMNVFTYAGDPIKRVLTVPTEISSSTEEM